MPQPNLIHPVPCKVEVLAVASQLMDDDSREPLHGTREAASTEHEIDGQVRWYDRTQSVERPTGGGEDDKGYVLFRVIDMEDKGIVLKKNDRITQLGAKETGLDLYVTELEPMGHWHDVGDGQHTLVRFFFSDRKPAFLEV